MAAREEEEFELVLGNKQLLSLFFLVVVLFGVFFSFGYTVGFNRGESSPTQEVASAEPVEEPPQKVQLPEALLREPPKPSEPAPTKSDPVVSTAARKEPAPSSPARTTPAKQSPKPRPLQQAAKTEPPPPTKTSAPAKTAPSAAPAPAKTSAPARQPSDQEVTNGTHLQISAVRVRKDAEVFVEQLRAKGHPSALSDKGDGWFRVVVGPFNSDAEAESYQKLLRQQGMDSLLRKR